MKRALSLLRLPLRRAPDVGQTPCDVVHHENKWRLLRYRPRPSARPGLVWRTPVLLVPSLINRHYVLDLMPGRSFVEYLVAQGHDVYTIDWGTPAAEDRYLSFDDICDRYLGRAIRRACDNSAVEQVHVLGYCLGGVLSAIHTAVHPERVASLTALSAPVDFHDDTLLSRWVRTRCFDVRALVGATGLVPWPLMQLAFHALRPTLNLTKGVNLLDRLDDEAYLDAFFATERWGNDNVSFPGACFRRYVDALYRDNALIHGRFMLRGRPVRLESIRCPTLVVTFAHDNIVSEASAAVLIDRIGSDDKTRIHLPGGHVGAVVSKHGAANLWPRLSSWWAQRDVGQGKDPWKMPRPSTSATRSEPSRMTS